MLQSQIGGSAEAEPPLAEQDFYEPMEESKFRLNARQLFLTYPKCPMPKEEALA